jgi:hypothetical protein
MSNDNERNMDKEQLTVPEKNAIALERIEKKLDKLDKKLDRHIKDIWTVYEPIKKILEKLERFKLW